VPTRTGKHRWDRSVSWGMLRNPAQARHRGHEQDHRRPRAAGLNRFARLQGHKTTAPGRSCTVVQQVSVGLDLNLPVGTSVARAACDLTTDPASATGAWLTAVGWVLRGLAWVFAALFIAGFTSAVRKT
jgi:hypothetical protein